MKFQNCILNFLNGCTDKPKAICPFNFSKVGGIKMDPDQLASLKEVNVQ